MDIISRLRFLSTGGKSTNPSLSGGGFISFSLFYFIDNKIGKIYGGIQTKYQNNKFHVQVQASHRIYWLVIREGGGKETHFAF